MTALTANAARVWKNKTHQARYKMVVSTTIYAGSIVMLNSDGLAVPAAAAASNQGCVGIAVEKVVSASSGDEYVLVQEGTVLLPGTTMADTSIGALCYAGDDNDVDETQGTNEPVAGVIQEVKSATEVWVEMGLEKARG